MIFKEGRNIEISKVANLLGYKLADLKSSQSGGFSLGNLKEGDWKLRKAIKVEVIQ